MMTKGLITLVATAFGVYLAPTMADHFGVWDEGQNLILQAVGAGVLGTMTLMVLTQRKA